MVDAKCIRQNHRAHRAPNSVSFSVAIFRYPQLLANFVNWLADIANAECIIKFGCDELGAALATPRHDNYIVVATVIRFPDEIFDVQALIASNLSREQKQNIAVSFSLTIRIQLILIIDQHLTAVVE